MGYSTKQEVIQALANAMSSGNPDGSPGTIDLVTIGKSLTDAVSDAELQQYIRWADENIDAMLSSIYATPFRRINRGSYKLAVDVVAGDNSVILDDATRFNSGDVVLIRDSVSTQQLTIATVPTDNQMTFTAPITNSHIAGATRIERIRYPDPIQKISARFAAANIYDKHFAAQVTGNQSDTGKWLRNMAIMDINGILAGTIRLSISSAHGYMGRRYYNAGLDDVISTKADPKEWFKSQ